MESFAWWTHGAVTVLVAHGLSTSLSWPIAALVGGATASFLSKTAESNFRALFELVRSTSSIASVSEAIASLVGGDVASAKGSTMPAAAPDADPASTSPSTSISPAKPENHRDPFLANDGVLLPRRRRLMMSGVDAAEAFAANDDGYLAQKRVDGDPSIPSSKLMQTETKANPQNLPTDLLPRDLMLSCSSIADFAPKHRCAAPDFADLEKLLASAGLSEACSSKRMVPESILSGLGESEHKSVSPPTADARPVLSSAFDAIARALDDAEKKIASPVAYVAFESVNGLDEQINDRKF
jgi:hypothetical protein